MKTYSTTDLSKGSCDDFRFESKIGCIKGHFVCRSDEIVANSDRIKYLSLNQETNACSTGIYSPVNSSEVQGLSIQSVLGNNHLPAKNALTMVPSL